MHEVLEVRQSNKEYREDDISGFPEVKRNFRRMLKRFSVHELTRFGRGGRYDEKDFLGVFDNSRSGGKRLTVAHGNGQAVRQGGTLLRPHTMLLGPVRVLSPPSLQRGRTGLWPSK